MKHSLSNKYAKHLQSFVMLCLSLGFFFTASAQAASEVYLDAAIQYRPVFATDSIDIIFKPSEQLCRPKYGDDWKSKCSPNLGRWGDIVTEVETKSWPKGEWKWVGSDTLRFQPYESWKSDTYYNADIKNLPIPPRVKLSSTNVGFHSLPRSAQMGTAQVWIDPSAKAEHALSFSMRFTESISEALRKDLESKVYPVAKANTGLMLGKGNWVWLDDNTRAVVNAPILSLPKKESTVTLSLPNIRPLYVENNSWQFPDKNAEKGLIVQGTETLFALESVRLDTWQNKSLETEQHIIFKFSQRVAPQDLLKALTLLELPLKRSAENIKNTDWKEGNISPQSRADSRKLKAEIVHIPDENQDFIRLRINTSPEHYVLWSLPTGFGPTNDKGIKTPLSASLEGVEYVPADRARLAFLQAGNILMQDSNLVILSEHVDSVRYKAYRFEKHNEALPFLQYMDYTPTTKELNATSIVNRGEISLPKQIANNTPNTFSEKPLISTLEAKKVFSNAKGELVPGLVYLHLEGVKDGKVVLSQGKMLLYSNMSMVLKNLADGSTEVYTCSMTDAKALANIEVNVLGYNGISVAKAKTNAEGKAVLPNLLKFSEEQRPTAITLRQQSSGNTKDMLWMSVQDYHRYLNLSQFAEINGKQSSLNTLNAFVFPERGFFRPGETLRFGTLLRSNDWKYLPKNMPLFATVFDEAGRSVFQKTFQAGENIHSFAYEIPQDSLTGRYTISIATPSASDSKKPGIVLGSTSVSVEMFLPDTLRIATNLVSLEKQADGSVKENVLEVSDKGWVLTSGDAQQTALKVNLDNLFGQYAANRRVAANMTLYPAYLSFTGYEDYTFQDLSPFFGKGSDSINRPLSPSITDKQGEALIPLDFSQWRFGTLQCVINTEGYEADGGRAVRQEKRFILSPLPYMIGYKAGMGAENINFILKDSMANLEFQALNPKLAPINPGTLQFSIAKRNMVSSLVSDSQGQYTYDITSVDTPLSKNDYTFTDDGRFTWKVATHEVGEFVLTVKIPASGNKKEVLLANVPYSVVGNDDLRPALRSIDRLPKAHLSIKTDKQEYTGGETAKIMLTAPYEGVALLSLERDKVSAHKWVKVPLGNSMHELEIPKDFSGRGFIQVLMGRSPKSDAIFLQPKGMAMTPVTINIDNRKLSYAITAPEKVQPGKNLKVQIKNEQKKATKAIVFAVDEGVLQLSGFETPDPLNHLLLDRALEVSTVQLFDRLMANDKKLLSRLSAFGGGEMANKAFMSRLGSFDNPFKRVNEAPLTWWSGVVDIPANGLDLEIPIPDYFNGALRIMVVAHEESAVGNAEASVLVQDTQILSPQVPLVVAPNDRFEGALALTNTTDKAVKVSLKVELISAADNGKNIDDILQIQDFAQTIEIGAKDEKLIPFKANAGNTPGEVTLRFTSEDEQGVIRERKTSMSIRPAVLPRLSAQSAIINQSTDLHTNRTLLTYDAQTSLTLSPVPLPLLQSALNYLHHYPYDCTEQILSKAFPLVMLGHSKLATELSKSALYLNKENIENAIKDANNVLIASFRPSNGISLWRDRYSVDLMLTAYAADYLLALKDAGQPIPVGMVPQVFDVLKRQINQSPNSIGDLRARTYASWVLARAGYVVSRQLELCEAYIKENSLYQSDIFHTLMAGAYEALYMQEDAKKHLNYVLGKENQFTEIAGTMFDILAQQGLHSRVLAEQFPKEFQANIGNLQEAFQASLNKKHTTMGASMTAMALMEIVENTDTKNLTNMQDVQVLCQGNTKGQEIASKAEIFQNMYILNAPQCTKFSVQLPKAQKLFAQIQSYGYDSTLPKEGVTNGLRVTRTLSKADGTLLGDSALKVSQGEVLTVDLDVNLLKLNSAPVVIVDLIPGGFELVLNHKDDTNNSSELSLRKSEDRIIAYLDATKNASRIRYHIRAVNKGVFTLPTTQAEGLFDRNLESYLGTSQIEIVAPE